jgi:adenosylmethionine-8-amino-7-oxononanoate aminotransferase
MHAWEQEDIRGPDIQTIGKALGAGFVPLSGVLLHEKIFQALTAGSGGLAHGHTFQVSDGDKTSSFQANIKQAHPLACAAAIAAQNILQRDKLLQQVVTLGKRLEALLCREIGPLPLVGDIRGRGLFWAVEFVIDKKAKTSFPLEANFSNKVVANALKRGVNILGNLGHTGTYQVDHILVCPPYITTEEELEKIVALVKGAIVETSLSFI